MVPRTGTGDGQPGAQQHQPGMRNDPGAAA